MSIYTNLAVNSLRKNKNFYVPYIASSAVMFTLFYTLLAIGGDPMIRSIHGGRTLTTMLNLGLPVIALLSALFIIYMSSFIMKRRKKELGLYSVLGMEKRHIIRVVFIENIIVALLSIVSGTILGIATEKLMQLILLAILKQPVDWKFTVNLPFLGYSWLLFGAIFLFIILNSIRSIIFRSTLDYIRQEREGEKKPRAKLLSAIIGLLILGLGYYLACTVTSGIEAIERFFIAVILVIIGTYILFIVGSVTVLELMKKNKSYYYKTSHFISVSGMAYRMKRNGAGLASICILSTMVLVMISSVTTMFYYNGKVYDERFSYDFNINAKNYSEADTEEIIDQIYVCAEQSGTTVSDLVYYQKLNYMTNIDGNLIRAFPYDFNHFYEVWVISCEDYNKLNGTSLSLEPNQVGYIMYDQKFTTNTLNLETVGEFEAVELDEIPRMICNEYTTTALGELFIVLNDTVSLEDYAECLNTKSLSYEDGTYFRNCSYEDDTVSYSFNVDGGDNFTSDIEADKAYFYKYTDLYLEEIPEDLLAEYNTNFGEYNGLYRSIFSSELFKTVFTNMYGGLFFLGIILSIGCIVIAVLIMYFKQLLEGYEDAGRFSIMKKVGLTADEIKKSIYSQIVLVFLIPLIAAGIHTAFAYKMIKSLIFLFGITSINGYFIILLICMAVFMVLYGIVFWITSGRYFKIVNAAGEV